MCIGDVFPWIWPKFAPGVCQARPIWPYWGGRWCLHRSARPYAPILTKSGLARAGGEGGQNRGSDGASLKSSTDVKNNLFFKQIGTGCSWDGGCISLRSITVRINIWCLCENVFGDHHFLGWGLSVTTLFYCRLFGNDKHFKPKSRLEFWTFLLAF